MSKARASPISDNYSLREVRRALTGPETAHPTISGQFCGTWEDWYAADSLQHCE